MHRLHMITFVIIVSFSLLQLKTFFSTPGKPIHLEGDHCHENALSENDFMAAGKADESGGLKTGKELRNHQEQILQLQASLKDLKITVNDALEPEGTDEGNLELARVTVHQRPADTDPPPPHIHGNLLLTSIGRSGSSFLGELLASQGNNMYFYEPIRALGIRSNSSEEVVRAELLRTFQCQIREALLHIGKSPSISIKHKYIYGKKLAEVRLPKVVELCKNEPLRILKTIRTRLNWTEELLDDRDLNLKVIHLVRDPRGLIESMRHLNMKLTPSSVCKNTLEDLQERETMEALYPDRYFFIKYEDLCRDPYGQMRLIFRFLRGEAKGHDKYTLPLNQASSHKATNGGKTHPHLSETDDDAISPSDKAATRLDSGLLYSDLPEGVVNYLQSHTHVNILSVKNPWTTVRDTSSIYQKWRKIISQEELTQVETNCRQVIEILNHRFFGTVRTARNLSIPLSNEPKVLS